MSLREKKSFFGKLSERLSDVINARSVVDEELFDELEEILITSDIGMDTTMRTEGPRQRRAYHKARGCKDNAQKNNRKIYRQRGQAETEQ